MEEASAQAGSSSDAGGPVEVKKQAASLKAELLAKHGESQRDRIDRGVDQVFALWRSSDGDLSEFVRSHFIADPKLLETTLQRFEYEAEQLDGHFNEIIRELKRPTDLDLGPLLPVDPLLAAFDPSAHLTEDLFQARIAFEALLNFPLTTLEERLAHAREYSRGQWTEVRLTAKFSPRIPGEIQQDIARAASGAELYIAQYNIWMHHLITDKGERLFPKGLRLITHWNLRDELKGDYADPRGPEKQKLILEVMERIVTQTIPQAVIDNPLVDWNPTSNEVRLAPAAEVEQDAPAREAKASPDREPDTRYVRLLAQFAAGKKADPYSPVAPTVIARSFEGREIPEARVAELLTEVLTSPLVPSVAA
ncbi:MAG TPA: hypothetical protein VKE49_02610, partial [Myxococcaceae bacterium]|nr:hypothetical protein [Myxococcaceae bacterium]